VAVAVNVSAVEFRGPGFLDNVRAVLNDTGLEARYLELELTEGSLIQHVPSTAVVLQGLKALGVQVAIDDFGTGYSGLSYLRQFPVNVLKIDRSFVHENSADPVGTAIIEAVIGMGKSLGSKESSFSCGQTTTLSTMDARAPQPNEHVHAQVPGQPSV
jgi:diguanylate cyclase